MERGRLVAAGFAQFASLGPVRALEVHGPRVPGHSVWRLGGPGQAARHNSDAAGMMLPPMSGALHTSVQLFQLHRPLSTGMRRCGLR